ncbi:MAG: chromosome segregation protein SMC [Methylocystaceae bacterium]
MYLKSLDIRGFKSFAEATHIEFANGLNLIVGPNGCGKSNLVDAIRWVLGEQNVRNLRGQKLEDVIFAGTDNKRPLSLASVSLTLDNSDQSLPSPFTEVMVNRRVYRSEQSEFYLNQQAVRLKDINQLFNGTGVGRKGYAIIGQGEIENLLSARPYDIRLMLEEASGLIRYRYQKDEAMERLRATDRDLQRLQDITGELETRLQDLKVKAEKAARYLTVSSEQQQVHTTLLKSEWSVLKREVDQLTATLADHLSAIEIGNQELAQLEASHQSLFTEHQRMQEQLDEVRSHRFTVNNELNQLSAQRTNLIDRVAEASKRIAEIQEEKARQAVQTQSLQADLDASVEKLRIQAEAVRAHKQHLQQMQQAWDHQAAKQQMLVEQLEELRTGAMEKAQQAVSIRNQIKHAQDEINQFVNRRQQYDLEIEQRQQSLLVLQEQETRISGEAQSKDDDLKQISAQLDKVKTELTDLIKNRELVEGQLQESQRHLVQIRHELQTLQTIEENYTGYSEAVKVLLHKHQKNQSFMPGLLGVVGELIQVPAGLETAIEVALGRGLENLIVNSETDARQGIEMLKREKSGRATFLPLEILKTEPLKPALVKRMQQEPGVLGIASDLVNYPPAADKAFTYLLGRVVIVDTLENGLRLLRETSYNLRLVTREGEVLLPQGAITGGKRQHDASVLKRKAQRQLLSKELEQIKLKEQNLQLTATQLLADEKQLRDKTAAWQQRDQEINYRITRLAEEIQQIAQQIKQATDRLNEIKWQRRLLDQDIDRREQAIQEQEEEVQLSVQAETATQTELEACQQRNDELWRQVEVGREKINTQEAMVQAGERELATLRHTEEQYRAMYENLLTNNRQQEQRITSLTEQKRNYENQIAQLAKDSARKETEQLKLSEQEQLMQNQLQVFNNQASVLLNQLNTARFEMEKLQEKRRQYELRLARQETEFQLFDQQLPDEEKNEPVAVLSEKKLRELRHEEARLNKVLDEIGPVDPGSVDEFKLTSERFSLLSTQHHDLTKARQSLIKLVKDSEQIMQGRFSEFLSEATASFNQTFTDIFGGGEASLQLLEDDEGSGGVELQVKMPGKKRQSLNMLSGGERALTCIALIFSLLRLKPVPFCLLDEIDAALDEVNLQRFAHFIRQLAEEIQFIIISHRQGTIEIAHTLYGVTMPQGGISTVISMQMQEAEQLVG